MQSNNERSSISHRFAGRGFARLAHVVVATAAIGGCGQGPLDLADESDTELRSHSPAATALPATTAVAWIDLLMKIVGDEKLGGPEAARLYAAASVALYESAVDGMPGYRSLGGQLNGLPRLKAAPPGLRLDWPTVMAQATGRLTTDLLATRPAAVAAVAALVQQQLATRAQGCSDRKVYARSLEHGQRLGDHLVAWMQADGFLANRDLPFTAPQGPDFWQPTGTAPPGTRPSEPYFSRTRPLVLETAGMCSPGAPPPYSEEPGSELWTQAQVVVSTVRGLTPAQDALGRFWLDGGGTPGTPGHWMSIARQLVANESLARAVRVFATVGITQLDAFISCWDTKFTYNHLRPETYIRRVIDPAWQPLAPTPQHPEHTSGHACAAGAASVALTALFGPRAFDDLTHVSRGLGARHFDDFDAAAAEAAVSRLYVGHHFPSGNEGGLRGGRCVGRRFLDRISLTTRARDGRADEADVADGI